MDTDISEDTLAYISRVNYVRMAKMCRMCLEDKEVLNINVDRAFRQLLRETLPDDRNFPQFICQDCRIVVEKMHQFSKSSTIASQLVQSFIAKGGSYPEPKSGKRSSSPDRDQKNPAKKQKTSKQGHSQIPEDNKENIKLEPPKEAVAGESKKTDRRKLEAKRRNVQKGCEMTKECLSRIKTKPAPKDDKENVKLEQKMTVEGDFKKKDKRKSEAKQRNVQEESTRKNSGNVEPQVAVQIKKENIAAGTSKEKLERKLEAKQKNVQGDCKMTDEHLFGSENDSDSDLELRF